MAMVHKIGETLRAERSSLRMLMIKEAPVVIDGGSMMPSGSVDYCCLAMVAGRVS